MDAKMLANYRPQTPAAGNGPAAHAGLPSGAVGVGTSGCPECDAYRAAAFRRGDLRAATADGSAVNYQWAGHCIHCDCDDASHKQHRTDGFGRPC